MKKVIFMCFVLGVITTFAFSVAAKNKKEFAPPLDPPAGVVCSSSADFVSFQWEPVEGAVKYSIDIEMVLTNPGFEGMTEELSFNTADREDGNLATDPFLSIHKADFAADLNNDGFPEQLYGEGTAKVKAMNPPGKGEKRQNHPFGIPDEGACTIEIAPPQDG